MGGRERFCLPEPNEITLSAMKTVLKRTHPDLDETGLQEALADPKVSRLVLEINADPGFPRVWKLLAFALPREVRTRVFEPAHQELLEDYLVARGRYRAKWSRRWLIFCFTVRTFLMIVDSLRAVLGLKAVRLLLWSAGFFFGGKALRDFRWLFFQPGGK